MMEKLSVFSFVLSVVGLLLIPVSCAFPDDIITIATQNDFSSKNAPSFSLYILEDDWHRLKLGYELEQSWEVLRTVDLYSSRALVITADDIEIYNWSEQSITLTSEASTRLKETFSHKKSLSRSLNQKGFVATFADKRLYGGIFLETGSAMGISFPVIYLKQTEDQIIFLLRPTHSVLIKYQDLEQSLKNIVEIQQVYDFFHKLGKLVE